MTNDELQAKVDELTARLSASRANVGLLQTTITELTAALIEFSEDKRFLGNYSDETQATIAALKQEVKGDRK